MIAEAIMPTLQALFEAPSTSPLAEIKASNVAELLVELTDVRHQMAAKQPNDTVVDEVIIWAFSKHLLYLFVLSTFFILFSISLRWEMPWLCVCVLLF